MADQPRADGVTTELVAELDVAAAVMDEDTEDYDINVLAREALAELVDAISDDLAYEVNNSPEVKRKIRAAVALLYGPSGDYHDAWWLS